MWNKSWKNFVFNGKIGDCDLEAIDFLRQNMIILA